MAWYCHLRMHWAADPGVRSTPDGWACKSCSRVIAVSFNKAVREVNREHPSSFAKAGHNNGGDDADAS